MRRGNHQSRPNIIVILIDTLRADHLSCYGYGRQTSPFIDRIAEQGVLYENAISPAAWTPPAHASLFTGAYPSRHGVDHSRLALIPKLVPLPEVLRRYGYRTFGISSNYFLGRETRFDRGFDRFIQTWQLMQREETKIRLGGRDEKMALGIENPNGDVRMRCALHACGNGLNALYSHVTRRLRRSFHAYDKGAWRVNHQVQRWVADWQRTEQPFFAFLHYMEPHIRYEAPGHYYTLHVPAGMDKGRIRRVNQEPGRYLAGRAEMSAEDFAILNGLYDGEISYVDSRVGQLYALLQKAGLLGNTLLIITSDHGENLGEHQLMSHSYCLYDTLLRVPLIIHAPTDFASGQRIPQQVQTLDLFPTILTLTGVRDADAWSQVQGQSLLPADLQGQTGRLAIAEYLEPQPSLPALRRRFPGLDGSQYDRILRTARTLDAKYIWASDGRDEFYDLRKDPHEEHNCIAVEAARAGQLRALLEEWLGSFTHAASGCENVDLDHLTIKRLEELGYLA